MMTQRESNLLWLKDTLEHLRVSRNQLEWAEDVETIKLLTDSMIHDLDRCKVLCEKLGQRARALRAS